jgi:class 3 adenylate cyclase
MERARRSPDRRVASLGALESTMNIFSHWSIRYKLLGLLLLLGVATFAVTGTIAYIKNQQALKQDVISRLTGLNRTKAFQIQSYYQTVHNHVESLDDDRMFIEAIRDFSHAYLKLNSASIPAKTIMDVHEDYRQNFYPEMQKLHVAHPRIEDYLPSTPAALQLQYLYIVKNPNPTGQRDALVDAGDGSEYSRVHAKYHIAFRNIIRKFGYYDLYLIDFQSQQILYDVTKDRDFGTNLKIGPYRDSNLAKVVRKCLAATDPNDVYFTGFEPDEASRREATQYVASPIWDSNEKLGVFVLQLSSAAIDNIMSDNRNWKRNGLGDTGESVLIGPDYLLRSNPRAFEQNPESFLARLKSQGVPALTIQKIRHYKSTILQVALRSGFVDSALKGGEGTAIIPNPLGGGASLVAYMPIQMDGLHWVIASSMYLSEALKPISDMRRLFGWWGAGLLLLTVLAAWFTTRQILRPVNALVDAAQKVAAGDLTAQVDWKSKDELGLLSDTFNSMTKSIREKTAIIEEKNRENERLLLNILPPEIATRLKDGEHEIADNFADITVLFGDIVGFTALSSRTSAKEIVDILNGLFSLYDEAAQELGIEKIKTIGDCYMAVCGLPRPASDHADRMACMALRMVKATREYSEQVHIPLQLRIGINSGPVVAGVIGTSKFIYDLWGDTVNLASRMESTGVPGQIQVTKAVYERLKDKYEFENRGMVQVKGKGEIETWLLHGELRPVEVSR